MRTCKTCNEAKPLMDFYNHSNGNIYRECKHCWREYVKANRLVKLDYYRAYDKARANNPDRVAGREAYAETEAGKVSACAAKRRYIERNPVKRRAHNAVEHALRKGTLTKQPCEICSEQKAQAHHDDYSKPLEVRWLCTKHHAEWHRNNTPLCPEQTLAA